jgi:3-hydroxyisobutyrate dehydrogenase
MHRIGFIGLGNMGSGMAARLAEAGYDIAVHNRTRAKAEEVEKLGARFAESPAAAAEGVDVLMTSLADEDVVEQMLFGRDGAVEALAAGSYIIDLSTVSPDFARALAERASAAGLHAMDACVYGAPMHARTGELRVMVGADRADYDAVEDILQAIGKDVTYLGPNGLGATMKLVVNMLMGVQMPALAEALVFGEAAGLSREAMLKMINGSGYSSPVMNFRCGLIGAGKFDNAAFKLKLMRKDMKLMLHESQELGVPMPVSEAAYAMLTAAMQQGLGDLDVAAIVPFMQRMAGMGEDSWPVPDGRTMREGQQ